MYQITKEKVQSFIPKREKDSYKGSYGSVLVVGGNENMGGATILTASASVYSGTGLVTVATHPANQSALHARLPEAMFIPMSDHKQLEEKIESMSVIIVGPGLGRDQSSLGVLRTVYENTTNEQVLVVDGDAIYLHVNEDLPKPKAQLVFTPHLGEWRTLTGLSPDAENEAENKEHVNRLDAIVVLKKDRTEVYYEDEVWKNTAGNPSMATGGMGDTLAGMLGGFLAQFKNEKHALLSAVFVHSYIADVLSETYYVTLPTHIIEAIPKVMTELVKNEPIMWA